MNQIASLITPYEAPRNTAAITLTALKAQLLTASLSARSIWHCVEPLSGTDSLIIFKTQDTPGVKEVLDGLKPAPVLEAPARELISSAIAAIDELSFQIEQMQGLFPDEDGTIAAALENAEETVMTLRAAIQ